MTRGKKGILLILFIINCIGVGFVLTHLPQKQSIAVDPFVHCQNTAPDCQDKVVQNLITTKGIPDTLKNISSKIQSDSSFLGTCHDVMHRIGRSAYTIYETTSRLDVTADITMCSYGFYHGMMEESLQSSQNYQKVRSFCSYINTQLKDINLEAECYHGIGHGIVLSHDTNLTPRERVQIALNECEKVSKENSQRIQCSSGVFNGIGNLFLENASLIQKANPSYLCLLQKEEYKATCYAFMARVYLHEKNGDFLATITDGLETVEKDYQYNFVLNAANNTATQLTTEKDMTSRIMNCKTLLFQTECLNGSAVGLLQIGKPGSEYTKPFEFCSNTSLTSSQKRSCFEKVLPYLAQLYPKDKREKICNTVPNEFQEFCTE